MASLLRQIVAGPRMKHQETGLDLCYVTDNIIATSGPSGTYPQVAYRNPLKELVSFLDSKHGDKWSIWEFRAEGTGYPDAEVYNRIRHYPWPDHHPPPFMLMPNIMASMRNWLKDESDSGKVAVMHCKAGKGRTGTVTCSYLVSEEGWTPEDAMKRFTEKRMRPGFGAGLSIPSQRRTLTYVDRWTKYGKRYIERPAQVMEIHLWGLRDGVKVAVEGYEQEGKVIKTVHTFTSEERDMVRGKIKDSGVIEVAKEILGKKKDDSIEKARTEEDAETGDVVFRPSKAITTPTSDINIDIERRNRSKIGGFTMVTAVAHVWFNIFFEGKGPEQDGKPDESGVFEIDWEALDGLKGSARKGTKAFDKMSVVWRVADSGRGKEIKEPGPDEPVAEAGPADWRAGNDNSDDFEKKLGLREAKDESAPISRAESMHDEGEKETKDIEQMNGVKDDSDADEGTRSDAR